MTLTTVETRDVAVISDIETDEIIAFECLKCEKVWLKNEKIAVCIMCEEKQIKIV